MGRLRIIGFASGLLAIAAITAGCGDAAPHGSDPVTSLEAAWQPQPMPVPNDIGQAAVRACRAADRGSIPQTSTAVIADVRGGGRIAVVFAGPREQVFLCLLDVSQDGGLSWATGWGGDRHSAEGPLLAGEIRPEEPRAEQLLAPAGGARGSLPEPAEPAAAGSGPPTASGQPAPTSLGGASLLPGATATVSTATGRAGRAIAEVQIDLASGATVTATTAAGWYAAWWPNGDEVTGYQAIDGTGRPFGLVQH